MIRHSTSTRVSKIVPFQESVTFYARTVDDTFVSYSVGRAHRKKINFFDKSFPMSVLANSDLIWEITNQYLTIKPAPDDYLIDQDGLKWQVLSSVTQFNGTVYKLACRKMN